MSKINVWAVCVLASAWLLMGTVRGAEVKVVEVGDLKVSGPYVHKNIAVFLVHGADRVKNRTFLTLDEALAKGVAVMHETGDVGELAVENKSKTEYVYIQSGVIVKGGKQDRTLRYDMVVPPLSGKVSVQSFCVEAGRWRQRGGEAADKFASSKSNLSTKELKLAAKLADSQQQVWENVAKTQGQLKANLDANVQSDLSATSLQLTLESEELQKAVKEYTKALGGIAGGGKDVIGYAFAVNGEVSTADVYGSADLFAKLWPGLLEASAVEAIVKLDKDKTFAAPGPDAVKALFLDAEKAKKTKENLTAGAKTTILESKDTVLLRVADPKAPEACLRMEYYRMIGK